MARESTTKDPNESPKTLANPMSSTSSKEKLEVIENVEVKPSPTIETPKSKDKVVEIFQYLNNQVSKSSWRRKFS
jgi:hypothetical protein